MLATKFMGVESVDGLKHHKFDVCGGPMSVYEAGDPAKPSVVMLHGAMYDESRFIWDQMFPLLSNYYHVFVVDTPRHGKSRPWDGYMDSSRLMEILEHTFTWLELKHFSIIGLSMGGGLAIEYASRKSKQITSLVLFEPGGLGDKLDKHLITWLYIKTPGMLKYLNKRYVKKDRAAIIKLLESLYVGGTKPIDPDRLAAILEDEIVGKFENKENDMDDWQLSYIGPTRLKWNLLSKIPLIQCPSLWLRGAESVLVKQHEMERALSLAKEAGANATFRLIENAGHLLPLEQPEKANNAVKEFLDIHNQIQT
jgi:pimeloyl-ACP methyl ester carboxylesterase